MEAKSQQIQNNFVVKILKYFLVVAVWGICWPIAWLLGIVLTIIFLRKNEKYKKQSAILNNANDEATKIRADAIKEAQQILNEAYQVRQENKAELEKNKKSNEEIESIRTVALEEVRQLKEDSLKELYGLKEAIVRAEADAIRYQNESKKFEKIHKLLSEQNELDNLHFYAPQFAFESSVDFEREIAENRRQQKALLTQKKALEVHVDCKEKTLVAKILGKLALRAFNSECDEMLFKVNYKNVVTYENRVQNAYEQINEWMKNYEVVITKKYLDLKLAELKLVYEIQAKKKDEEEEQRRAKEIIRDEIKAEREMERVLDENKKQQKIYQDLLDKMLVETQNAQGKKLDELNAKVAVLQAQLEDAKAKERAISQAQITKAGYVYVISNVGSFGSDIYKIGMTRRLEPMERIEELGDASVPFSFDVHAIIYHENAPELERILHEKFRTRSVNKINPRKEFFNVTLDEIEAEVKKHNGNVTFTKKAEAQEWRQSQSMAKLIDK